MGVSRPPPERSAPQPPKGPPEDRDEVDGPKRAHYVIRVPQAYAVMLVAALLGAIVLAYAVGLNAGRRAGEQAGYEKRQRELDAQNQAARRIRQVAGSPGVAQMAVEPGDTTDPRQAGLNYFVVCRYPEAEARRAQAFLAEHGVASFLQQDQNTPFFEVIAMRGFKADQLRTDARQFERELERLGRLWKQSREYKGPSEFDPYPRKYTPGQ